MRMFFSRVGLHVYVRGQLRVCIEYHLLTNLTRVLSDSLTAASATSFASPPPGLQLVCISTHRLRNDRRRVRRVCPSAGPSPRTSGSVLAITLPYAF